MTNSSCSAGWRFFCLGWVWWDWGFGGLPPPRAGSLLGGLFPPRLHPHIPGLGCGAGLGMDGGNSQGSAGIWGGMGSLGGGVSQAGSSSPARAPAVWARRAGMETLRAELHAEHFPLPVRFPARFGVFFAFFPPLFLLFGFIEEFAVPVRGPLPPRPGQPGDGVMLPSPIPVGLWDWEGCGTTLSTPPPASPQPPPGPFEGDSPHPLITAPPGKASQGAARFISPGMGMRNGDGEWDRGKDGDGEWGMGMGNGTGKKMGTGMGMRGLPALPAGTGAWLGFLPAQIRRVTSSAAGWTGARGLAGTVAPVPRGRGVGLPAPTSHPPSSPTDRTPVCVGHPRGCCTPKSFGRGVTNPRSPPGGLRGAPALTG